jgi:hypothetical protein
MAVQLIALDRMLDELLTLAEDAPHERPVLS